MNRNKIFYTYLDSNITTKSKNQTIDSIIKTKSIDTSTSYNETAKSYLDRKMESFIKIHNKRLDIKESQLITLAFLPRHLFLITLTKSNTNHPYGLYVDLDSNVINFIIPFGKERKQAEIEDYTYAIDKGTLADMAMIYIIMEKTILVRKKAILTPGQFTLLDCSNITGCIKKRQEIVKSNLSVAKKEELLTKYNIYYLKKAVEVLEKYFELLDNQDWNEALNYLRGTDKKYFGKERVNTFFKNTKKIIGHLEILISIYELYFYSRNSLITKLQLSK